MTHLWKYRGKPLLFPLLPFCQLFTFTDDIFDRVECEYLVCLLDGICQLHHYQENNG